MSTIPPPSARRCSTPILRSLDTLSPPPSWSSLDNLAAYQVGSIPLVLHAGLGDFPNLITGTCSDAKTVDSSPTEPSDRQYKGISLHPHNNTAVGPTECRIVYHKFPGHKRGLENPCPERHGEETRNQTPAMLMPHPQRTLFNSACTPESSPEKSRRIAYKGSVHAASENSPTRNRPSDRQATLSNFSPRSPEAGDFPECHGRSGHKRKGSTSTTDSGFSSHSNLSCTTHDSNRIISENASIGTARFPDLPVSLSWLQSTTLEIMIDQEGFRMIKPVFRFAGYSWPTTTEGDAISLGVHLVSAMADFMPLQRKSFAFHHSSLDTPPVLRRLMANGDRSRDYLSRQAYLILKANGPYTVQGTELVQSLRHFPAADPPVLVWRFDYVVGDRRTEAGRIIPGEKTLTPLIFTCSPALLQSTQAKKIRVVHVVKKSVATKLTATKVEPPMPPCPCPALGTTSSSNADSELREAAIRKYKLERAHSNVLRDTLTLGISTLGPAQLTSSILPHSTSTSGVFLPVSDSP